MNVQGPHDIIISNVQRKTHLQRIRVRLRSVGSPGATATTRLDVSRNRYVCLGDRRLYKQRQKCLSRKNSMHQVEWNHRLVYWAWTNVRQASEFYPQCRTAPKRKYQRKRPYALTRQTPRVCFSKRWLQMSLLRQSTHFTRFYETFYNATRLRPICERHNEQIIPRDNSSHLARRRPRCALEQRWSDKPAESSFFLCAMQLRKRWLYTWATWSK